jgi:glyoxylate reductase
MLKVFVAREVPGVAIPLLRDAFGAEPVGVYASESTIPRGVLLESVQGVEGILTLLSEKVDAELLDAAGPGLRIVANMAVGYDNIDVAECTRRGVAVTNTPDVLTETTADLAFGLMISAARRFAEGEAFLRGEQWKEWTPTLLCGMDVYGKTLGIFGMGRIGQAVARRAVGFGMRVLYTKRNRLPEETERALNASHVGKDQLLAESDFISVHCPFNAETRHAFGAAEFAAMKRTAVFVNTSRGAVVDEAAMAAALQAEQIFAAGLDVFEREPGVHAALLACRNVVLIPHLGSTTYATRERMAETAARNIVAMLRGESPPNCLNPEVLR